MLVAITTFVLAIFVQPVPGPDVTGLLQAALFGDSTVYARGYTDAKFQTIKVGLMADDVTAVLGPPLKVAPCGNLPSVWYCTDQKTVVDNLWRRLIAFEGGKFAVVAEVISDFWVD